MTYSLDGLSALSKAQLAGCGSLRASADSQSHAGSTVAAGRAKRWEKGRTKTGRYAGPPAWGLGVRVTSSPRRKSIVYKPRQTGGRGPNTDRSAIEKDEEKEEELYELRFM